MNSEQALVRNMRTCRPDVKGETDVVLPHRKSTDAGHRGGPSRSSDEASVMEVEQRGWPVQLNKDGQPHCGRNRAYETKPYQISKQLVLEAYKRVKANKGSAGVDVQSLTDFEVNLKGNLYKLWNRLSSGSYHPPPVLRVEIPKTGGGVRPLGIPTVTDRIAQMVVKLQIEPELERHFHPGSYGYRPEKSAHQALRSAKERCNKRAWVLDIDIKGFFDAIDHDLLMRAVKRHVKEPWQLLYIQRWLKAPVQYMDGHRESRSKGTPQGGVISPLLANLYLHYVFDVWVEKHWGGIQFERYADDIVCHCSSEREAQRLKQLLETRFTQCGLQLHPGKTKIMYCKGGYHTGDYKHIAFDFLGYTFRPRWIKTRQGKQGLYFIAAISRKSAKRLRKEINGWPWKYWYQKELAEIRSYSVNKLRGWLSYYGLFGSSIIRNVLFHFDKRLSRWGKAKYKQLKTLMQAARWINRLRQEKPHGFPHWGAA
jgi:group II intron reverse transcriptase/maturase